MWLGRRMNQQGQTNVFLCLLGPPRHASRDGNHPFAYTAIGGNSDMLKKRAKQFAWLWVKRLIDSHQRLLRLPLGVPAHHLLGLRLVPAGSVQAARLRPQPLQVGRRVSQPRRVVQAKCLQRRRADLDRFLPCPVVVVPPRPRR